MTKENLPLELLNKHKTELGLVNPLMIDDENKLFQNRAVQSASAVVFLPKSKPLIDMTLALVSEIVKVGGVIVLVGTNEAGISSAKKLYETNIGPVEQKIVGKHSALYVGHNKSNLLSIGDQGQDFNAVKNKNSVEDFFSYFDVEFKNVNYKIASLPGVFSAGELDEGTKMLLDCIPYDKKSMLDAGCGAGIIGVIYKKLMPECGVTMSDSSLIALEATKETLKQNNLTYDLYIQSSAIAEDCMYDKKEKQTSNNVCVVESDVFSNIDGQFKLILTNPPFHKGVGTDYTFIEKFAKGARAHLIRGGEIYVVANSFLRYQPILEKHIGPTTIVKHDTKFTVYKSVVE